MTAAALVDAPATSIELVTESDDVLAQNYMLTEADERWMVEASATQRFANNVDAIRRVKEIENGRAVTSEDRTVFARYTGMGDSAFNDAFPHSLASNPNPRLVALGAELRALVGDDEYASLGRSRVNAHFTSPTVVRFMWSALERMGVADMGPLHVLEPSAGSGRFLGLMPAHLADRAIITAVEMDILTGAMLRHLYPRASVHVAPLQRLDVEAPGAVADNSQDVVISNVPFGNIRVADPVYAKQPELTNAVHNYFFVKGIDKARPGGVVAFITSHYTFDAASSGREDFRRYLDSRAELLGAVRLPSDTFNDTAVTTDILFFRKRETVIERISLDASPAWVHTDSRTYEGEHGPVEVAVNRYFLERSDMALGVHGVSRHNTSPTEGYVLLRDVSVSIADRLQGVLAELPASVLSAATHRTRKSAATIAANKAIEGSYVEFEGALHIVNDGGLKPAGRYVRRTVNDLTGQPIIDVELRRNLSKAEQETAKAVQLSTGTWPDWAVTRHKRTEQVWTLYTDSEVARVRAMLELHDLGREVLDLQRAGEAGLRVTLAQGRLRVAYDKFVQKYGPLHNQTNRSIMRTDARSYWLQSLENWGEKLEQRFKPSARKGRRVSSAELAELHGDIFTKIVQAPAATVRKVETAKDALAVSLNDSGRLDLERMSALLDRPAEDIAAELHAAGLLYRNPAKGGAWESADAYLSGTVKVKLAEAKAAAESDDSYQVNVRALEEVQPVWIEPGDIDVRLGTSWVPASDVNQFVRELLFKAGYQSDDEAVFRLQTGADMVKWAVARLNTYRDKIDTEHAAVWGTGRVTAVELIEHGLNARPVRVLDDVSAPGESPKYVLNEEATRAATGKLRAIKAEFVSWLWSDAERSLRLATYYNNTFNNTVLRTYDGSHLEFANANPQIHLRQIQKNAVWRSIVDPSMLLAHQVGFGKSMTMAAVCMELRRLGLARKPSIVVPNHLVGQMAGEFYKLYPQANLLVPTKQDYDADGRAALMARIASGDWDAVIFAQSQFKLLGVHPRTSLRFLRELEAELEAVIDNYQGEADRTFKALQKRLLNAHADVQRMEDRLRAFQARKGVLTWEDLGIDALFVDEADAYKNLYFFTTRPRIKGLPNSKSDRAYDMHIKTRLHREQRGHGLVFATGTPVSNTIAELWTMLRYLAPDMLAELGIASFDAWASVFGDTVEKIEQTLTGDWKLVTRFAKFGNAPELSKIFQSVADIRMAEDSPEMEALKPRLRGGRRIPVKSAQTPWHKSYAKILAHRASLLTGRPEKGGDNMLLITGDARKASLCPSMVGGPVNEVGKIPMLVDNVRSIWEREAANRGAQLVFLDLGTPKSSDTDRDNLPPDLKLRISAAMAEAGDAWDVSDEDAVIAAYYAEAGSDTDSERIATTNIYERIRHKLVACGIPRDEIAFIHEAKDDKARRALYQAVNKGDVRVLIGSTEKLGAGTNVQERLAALHHLDTPWRPRDLEQREGRALRPGNKLYGPPLDEHGYLVLGPDGEPLPGPGVEIYQYVTEWPFDAYLWSTLLAKLRAIKSMMRRVVRDRSVVDADEHVLSMEELEALASGDPMALKRRVVLEEERQLAAESRDHINRQSRAAGEVEYLPLRMAEAQKRIDMARTDIEVRERHTLTDFRIVVDGRTYDKRTDAGNHLLQLVAGVRSGRLALGTYRGFELEAIPGWESIEIQMRNPAHKSVLAPRYATSMFFNEITAKGIIARIEYLPSRIEADIASATQFIADKTQQLEGLRNYLKKPFAGAQRLQQLRDALSMIERRMAGEKKMGDNRVPLKDAEGNELPIFSEAEIDAVLEGAAAMPRAEADDGMPDVVEDARQSGIAGAVAVSFEPEASEPEAAVIAVSLPATAEMIGLPLFAYAAEHPNNGLVVMPSRRGGKRAARADRAAQRSGQLSLWDAA